MDYITAIFGLIIIFCGLTIIIDTVLDMIDYYKETYSDGEES